MSNDLSANMRRSRMDAKSDERRLAGKKLSTELIEAKQEFYKTTLEKMDTHAKAQGWTKTTMLLFADNIGLPQDFLTYYSMYSQAFDG